MNDAHHRQKLPDMAAIDGIRALSVAAVLVYHAGLGWLPGGFLGVEVFFVVSGYLITSLLVLEWVSTGTIDLKRFWLGRARRLLPALFVVLAATAAFAVTFLPREVADLRADTLAALGYVSNWYLIFSEQSYFEMAGRPPLLRHLWSLAVEEQFYLVWPVIMGVLLWLYRGTRAHYRLLILILAGIVASTAAMAVLYTPGEDPSRLYYGTDTRAAALLVGAALALVWHPTGLRRDAGAEGERRRGLRYELAGLFALAALAALCLTVGEYDAFLYRGGFLVVSVAAAGLIAAVAHPGRTLVGSALSLAPIRWIGLRSYGIYLWHWPIFMVTRPGMDIGLQDPAALTLRIGATLVAAELSYRLVETPIRRGVIGRRWAQLRRARGRRRRALELGFGGSFAGVVLVCLVLAAAMVGAEEPERPEYLAQRSINTAGEVTQSSADGAAAAASQQAPRKTPAEDPAKGDRGLDSGEQEGAEPDGANAGSGEDSQRSSVPSGDAAANPASSERTSSGRTTGDGSAEGTAVAGGVREEPAGAVQSVTAVGDSVLVGAAASLEESLAAQGIMFGARASVGMQATEAVAILEELSRKEQLGEAVVIHIGNNGTVTEGQFQRMMAANASAEKVVVVNNKVPRPWEEPNNRVLEEGHNSHPKAVFVDWRAASQDHPEYFYSDGIHLTPEGRVAYSRLISEKLMG